MRKYKNSNTLADGTEVPKEFQGYDWSGWELVKGISNSWMTYTHPKFLINDVVSITLYSNGAIQITMDEAHDIHLPPIGLKNGKKAADALKNGLRSNCGWPTV